MERQKASSNTRRSCLSEIIYDPAAPVCETCRGQHRRISECIKCGAGLRTIDCFLCVECDLKARVAQGLLEKKSQPDPQRVAKQTGLPLDVVDGTKGLHTYTCHTKQHAWALEGARSWADGELGNKWLYLSGPPGTGKTHLAQAALYHRMRKEDRYGASVNVIEWIKYVRTNQDRESQIIEEMCECPLLVLDDLAMEKPSEWSINVLYSVLNSRSKDVRNKPTIITSNLDLEALGTRWAYGAGDEDLVRAQRVVRRIADNALWICFDEIQPSLFIERSEQDATSGHDLRADQGGLGGEPA